MIRTLTLALTLAAVAAALAAPAGARIDPPLEAPFGAGSTVAQDLRSPDARDAAGSRTFVVVPLKGDLRAVEARGFDWSDAALGSGVTVGLMLLAGAGALTLLRGRAGSRHAARI